MPLKAAVDQRLRAEPEEALRLSEVLLELVRDLPERAVLAERGHAAALHILGRTREALPHYERALELHRAAGERVEEGKVQRSLVDVYQMIGRTEDATRAAEAARAIFVEEGESRLLAQLEVNLGNVSFRLDDYAAAREAYLRARALFAELDDELGLAFVDYNLAGVETHAHDFGAAREAFERARRALDAAGMHVHVADCDYGLAYLRARGGEFAEAVEELERARAVYADSTKPSGVPLCDKDLAETYLRLDAWSDALEHADRAVRGFDELDLDYERAQSRVLRAQARYRLGFLDAALEDLGAAAVSFGALGNEVQRSYVEVLRAGWRIATEPERARETLAAARERLEGSEHQLLRSLAELELARALAACGQHDEALAGLETLRARRGDDRQLDDLLAGQWGALVARLHEALGQPERARDELRATIDRIDRAYLHIPGRDTRIAFFGARSDPFLELIRLDYDAGTPDALVEAWEVLERSRHRSLSEAPRGDAPRTERWRAARARVEGLLTRRLDEELGRLAGSAAPVPRAGELEEALAEFARELGPDRSTRGGPERPDLAAIRARLRDEESAIVYLPIRGGFAALAIDRERVTAIDLDAPRDAIRTLVRRVKSQVLKAGLGEAFLERRRDGLARTIARTMEELGERLLAPVLPHVGDELSISPYGLLHALPFHALRVDGEALVERRACSMLPSLSLLARPRDGDPEPTAAVRVSMVGGENADLPAIERELAALAEHFPSAFRSSPEGSDVTGFLRALDARALHVAGHASFVGEEPLFSCIQLGASLLTVYDLQGLQLDLDLVTFSGCQTGRVAELGGEDYSGLTHALLGAGVRSVVGSEWPVLDDDCADFMRLYYRELAGGADLRAAVCRAQRELAAERPHPLHWAAFSLSGDPHTRLTRS